MTSHFTGGVVNKLQLSHLVDCLQQLWVRRVSLYCYDLLL